MVEVLFLLAFLFSVVPKFYVQSFDWIFVEVYYFEGEKIGLGLCVGWPLPTIKILVQCTH